LSNVDLNKYKDFVQEVTSLESNSTMVLNNTMIELEKESGVNIALLLTKFHAKRELGDIMWYWINSCRALGIDPNEVVEENVNKLKARYPGGEFDVHFSENRKEGDL